MNIKFTIMLLRNVIWYSHVTMCVYTHVLILMCWYPYVGIFLYFCHIFCCILQLLWSIFVGLIVLSFYFLKWLYRDSIEISIRRQLIALKFRSTCRYFIRTAHALASLKRLNWEGTLRSTFLGFKVLNI